jgi:hypothetical protein
LPRTPDALTIKIACRRGMLMTPAEQRAILATAMKAAEVHCRAVTTAMASLIVPLIALMRRKGALSTEELNAFILASERIGPGEDEAHAMIATIET